MYMYTYPVSCDVRIWAAVEQRSRGQEEDNQEIEDKEKNHIGNLSSVISIIYSISKMLIVCPMVEDNERYFPRSYKGSRMHLT